MAERVEELGQDPRERGLHKESSTSLRSLTSCAVYRESLVVDRQVVSSVDDAKAITEEGSR